MFFSLKQLTMAEYIVSASVLFNTHHHSSLRDLHVQVDQSWLYAVCDVWWGSVCNGVVPWQLLCFFFTYVPKLLNDSTLSGCMSIHLLYCLLPVIEWLSNPCSSSSLKHSSSFLYTSQNAPWWSLLYSSQGNFSSHFCCTFICLWGSVTFGRLCSVVRGGLGLGSKHSESDSESLSLLIYTSVKARRW